MLECVINVSEGRDTRVLRSLCDAASSALLDLHKDDHHHRAVLSLAGPDAIDAAVAVARAATSLIDLRTHTGVHPRLGVVDVVPFVPIDQEAGPTMDLSEAITARDTFAKRVAEELSLPCFLYGPERSLPEVRRRAFVDLAPDVGPTLPNPSYGAVCVGARPTLVAYNLILEEPDLDLARRVAASLRSPYLRTLGLAVGSEVQVSCNLTAPWRIGPAEARDLVASLADVRRCELVGLLPESLLERVAPQRWEELDLSRDRTVEARLEALLGPSH